VWLLLSLLVLLLIGFLVVLVIAPSPISTGERNIDLEAIGTSTGGATSDHADVVLRELILRLYDGIRSNRETTNRMALLYLASTILLVVEIALIGIHFSPSLGYRIAIGVATILFCS
jgi:hypothetical protein